MANFRRIIAASVAVTTLGMGVAATSTQAAAWGYYHGGWGLLGPWRSCRRLGAGRHCRRCHSLLLWLWISRVRHRASAGRRLGRVLIIELDRCVCS
jgi:hypothetical protein